MLWSCGLWELFVGFENILTFERKTATTFFEGISYCIHRYTTLPDCHHLEVPSLGSHIIVTFFFTCYNLISSILNFKVLKFQNVSNNVCLSQYRWS